MRAGELDLYIERGTDWKRQLRLCKADGNAVNLRGCAVTMRIKEESTSEKIICLPQITITDENAGTLIIYISADQSASIPLIRRIYDGTTDYPYDIVVTDASGVKQRILNGIISIRG